MGASGETDATARAFVTARAAGAALPDYPGPLPASLIDGYRIQDAALSLDRRTVVGWKVGKVDPVVDGADRLVGPIFADQVSEAADPAMAVYAGGFAAAEAEFLLRLGTAPDPGKRHHTLDEAAALVGDCRAGIEIASSPYPGINAHGPAVTVSDFGNNNGLVIGPAIADWSDLPGWAVALLVNGAPIGAATGAAIPGGPLAAVRFLLEHMAARGRALPAGTWVSTGAVTGVHRVAIGDRIEARFADRLRVTCSIAAA